MSITGSRITHSPDRPRTLPDRSLSRNDTAVAVRPSRLTSWTDRATSQRPRVSRLQAASSPVPRLEPALVPKKL